jgi:NADPH:quinone reductase-like Zn-dependent oxidoreductase
MKCILPLLALVSTPVLAETVAITGGKVVIGDGSAPIEGGTVIISNGRVTAAGQNIVVPAGSQRIDATGKWVTPMLRDLPEARDKHVDILKQCAQWVDQGVLKTHITKELPLAEAATAHAMIESGHTVGKIVLTV